MSTDRKGKEIPACIGKSGAEIERIAFVYSKLPTNL